MSLELIGIIAATIALGTVTLASNRGIRHELRELRASDGALRDEIKGVESTLRDEIKGVESALRDEIKGVESALRDEIRAGDGRLRAEMQAGFKELTARVVNIGDRLSKVEGIIEGLFWSSRNQPPDKPREGVA